MKPNKLILKHAQVIKVETGQVVHASILIEGDTIKEIVEQREACDRPFAHLADAPVIDLQGKYVIPGLIDSHVHIKEGYAPYFVAAGVTTVRNTGGNVLELLPLIQAATDAPTPRVLSADRVIDGPPGLWGPTSPWGFITDQPELAMLEVQRQVLAGADLIKVYGWLPHHVMEVVTAEAKPLNRDISCDLIYSTQVNALDAARMGITWNEHASGIVQLLFPDWTMKDEALKWQHLAQPQPDQALLEDICSQMIEHGVKLCPTMIIHDQILQSPNHWKPGQAHDQAQHATPGLIGQWQAISQHTEGLNRLGNLSALNKLIAKTYYDLGGVVVAGTDVPAGIWTWPGMALHRELELFVEVGLSPLQALQAATVKAAQALKLDQLGAIQEGYTADLVILKDNPLDDIQHTQTIDRVIKGGKVYTREEILRHVPTDAYIQNQLQAFIKQFSAATGEVYSLEY